MRIIKAMAVALMLSFVILNPSVEDGRKARGSSRSCSKRNDQKANSFEGAENFSIERSLHGSFRGRTVLKF